MTGEWTEAAGERIFARRLDGPAAVADVVLVHGRSRATRTPPGIEPLGDAHALNFSRPGALAGVLRECFADVGSLTQAR